MNFSNYKFRCHYQGALVSVPKPLTENQEETLKAYRDRANGIGRPLTVKQKETWHDLEHKLNESKVYKLTNTAKNICNEIVWFERTGRKFRLDTKYFEKGLNVEKQSRDLVSEVTGTLLVSDNERKENEWVTGQRDIKNDKAIIDIKSTFNFTSFNKHLIDTNDEFYFRQLDCYMELWDIKESLIAYTLVDTPFKIIEDEIKRLDWKNNVLTMEGDVKDEKIGEVVDLVQNHLYTRKSLEDFCHQSTTIKIDWFPNFREIPKSDRLHLVPHSYSKERIEQRNECLTLCREHMNTVKPMNNINFNL